MKIAVAKEIDPSEPRVAVSPDTIKKFKALGAEVAVEPGAGIKSGLPDSELTAAGATVSADALKDADIIIKVKRPEASELSQYKRGALVIAIMDPYGNEAALKAMADAGVSAFAMELMPRITRAQVMDVLSSQANLAGYRAVIEGAEAFGRAFPMMMTAAGTVPAAKVFVMGVGVAGLQAIATARRLGAVVDRDATCAPPPRSRWRSLGAKFLAVEDEEFKNAQTAGGYAKEMSKEYQAKQAALTAEHIKKQDIVITTALIPGRPAPKLVSRRDGEVDEARLGAGRSRGRARRQCRGREARRGGRDRRHQDRRLHQCRRPGRGLGLQPLRAQPVLVHRDHGRQGQQGARGQLGRRAGEGHRADQGRRRHPSQLPAEVRSQAMEHLAQAVDPFVFRLSIFVLAVFVGYFVVWSVTPALHTPLMSVTNAISSVIVVGALLAVGVGMVSSGSGWARGFGFVALIFACVNIFGGFLVTQRMLAMYKKKAK